MNFNEYRADVYEDCMEIINDSWEESDNWDALYEVLFMCATGNADGSHYFNTYKAQEAVSDVIWDYDYTRMYGELPTNMGPEACDVIVRCNALSEIAGDLQEEWENLRSALEEE